MFNSTLQYTFSSVPTLEDFAYGPDSLRRITAVMGPFGSGKSSACIMKMLHISLEVQKPGPDGIRRTRWAVVRNTNKELEDTTIRTFKDWLPPAQYGRFYETIPHNYIITAWEGAHIEVMFRALDRPEQIKDLLSAEYTGAWFNEFREIKQEVFEGMDGRVGRYPSVREGGCTWFGIIMDTNPPSERSFWYEYFEKRKPNNARLWKQPSGIASDAENLPNLPGGQRYYTELAKGKDELYVKVFIRGEYGYTRDGKPVHPNYSDNIHYMDSEAEILIHHPLLIAFDFGLTPACVFLQQDVRGRIFVLEALSSEDMGIRQFCQEVVKPIVNIRYKHLKLTITGDPAGKEKSQIDKRTAYEEIQDQFPEADITPFFTNVQKVRRDGLENALMKMVDGKPAFQICGRDDKGSKEGGTYRGSSGLGFLREGLISEFKYPKLQVSYDDNMYRETPLKNEYSHVCESLEYGVAFIESGTFNNPTSSYKEQRTMEFEEIGWSAFT